MSLREQILTAVFARLQTLPEPTVRRNEALPASVPAGGLVILRDGDPGEPDVTLNPRTEFYTHRAEIEAFVTQPVGGGGETALDALLEKIGVALAGDRSLGGLAENLFWSAPEISVLVIEGAAPILSARITVTVEYLSATRWPSDIGVPSIMAKARAYGADSVLLAAQETTYGTAPASGYRGLDFKSTDLSSAVPLGDDPLLGRGRNAQDPYRGLVTDEGSVDIPLDVEGTGYWLTGLFGAPTTTGSGPYTHVWQSGADTIPSYTIEIGHPKLATPVFFRHTGVVFESLNFEMGIEGPPRRARPAMRPPSTTPPTATRCSASARAAAASRRGACSWPASPAAISPSRTRWSGCGRSARTARSTRPTRPSPPAPGR
jgi:hypothetical protein